MTTINQNVRAVRSRFEQLCANHQGGCEHKVLHAEVAWEQLQDSLDRFRLWSGNAGALKSSCDPLSLDSRLKLSPEVADLIKRILDDMMHHLHRSKSISIPERQKLMRDPPSR